MDYQPPLLGTFVCPSQDGDFTVTVRDLLGWATGMCIIRQEGQCQVSDQCYTREEARKLADILMAFANS